MTRRPARNAGITLVEMVIAITMATALMTVLTAVVVRVISANHAATDHLAALVGVGRLGEQFRRDVHAATSAKIDQHDQESPRILLSDDDGNKIEYTLAGDAVHRDASSSGAGRNRETYYLPGLHVVGCDRQGDDGRRLSLRIGRIAADNVEPLAIGGQFTIDALLATDRTPAETAP